MLRIIFATVYVLPAILWSQSTITIDGNFDDWAPLPVLVTDAPNDEHDTEPYNENMSQPSPRKYSDVDILEVKFSHDQENLYGYVKASGIIGQTSRSADGQKAGRYYFIITIDVDNNDETGYPLQEGGYWPNSTGYDMNMEVEFYDGSFNTGHYIHHGFLAESELEVGAQDLANHIIRLGPGNYDDYLQWVTFPDTSYVFVSDKGPVIEGGIVEVAVSADGHEAEMKAPMWGFFWDENGIPIVKLGDTIDISFSLEGSGELSESAIEAGYTGNKSVWGSDTADPVVGYTLTNLWNDVPNALPKKPGEFTLEQNYPNPFNPTTTISYSLAKQAHVELFIVNANGQIVRQLVNNVKSQGIHHVMWNGQDDDGLLLSSGIYFTVMKSDQKQIMRRMVLLK